MDHRKNRLKIYQETLGEPELIIRGDTLGKFAVDILAFPRNFSEECEEGPSQDGYLLITNGMSDMTMASTVSDEPASRAEILWYIKDLSDDKTNLIYWLATIPFIDKTHFSFGHFVSIPDPPIKDCAFRKLMFLTPIIERDKRMVYDLSDLYPEDSFQILTIHLLSDQEHDFAKKDDDHFNNFLDLIDKHKYPRLFDPKRKSYL